MKRYIPSSEQKITHEGNVGIWWFYNNKVIGEGCPVSDGVDDRGYIQFSLTDNHITMQEKVIREQLPEAIELISKGYRSIERGRVVYDLRSQVYEIICSHTLASDENAIRLIAEELSKKGLYKDIPFLNGGLFEPHNDDCYNYTTHQGEIGTLQIKNNWFIKLFSVFEEYNFTIVSF